MTAFRSPFILRWIVFVQVLVLLPVALAGSICIRACGEASLEFGACACSPDPGASAASWTAADEEACGPCRDEVLTAVRGPRVATPEPAVLFAGAVSPGPSPSAPMKDVRGLLRSHILPVLGNLPTILRC